ncbi:hypothetical protein E2C01_053186 [Portunus trituberculatus]|uniref:Uncharacterized protein n=1 Tax=Portunus trituberculatus TaxID=210409 RepID=A0A5B7GGF1_PORTR|nr:hypothetical protein [Portunus trituberculatus]
MVDSRWSQAMVGNCLDLPTYRSAMSGDVGDNVVPYSSVSSQEKSKLLSGTSSGWWMEEYPAEMQGNLE